MQGVRYYHKLIETFRTARAAAGAGVPFNRFHSPLGTSQPFIQRDVEATFEGVTNVERFTERVDPKRGRDWMENALHHLDHPETQRVLFDSEQAMVFAELGDLPGPELLRHLHLPFPRTYLELTRPIACETSEPGYLEELAAVLFREIPESERLELVTVKTGDREAMPVLPAPEGARLVQVVVFLQSYPTLSEEEVDRL
ncbi:MAG TPA: hypothetical protein VJ608_04830, partial [Albitalea sp.]|nr:hypothetical protein [Albitalea sp.]